MATFSDQKSSGGNFYLLLNLLAAQARHHQPMETTPPPVAGLLPYQLRRVTEYIDAHLAEEITLRELGRALGMSEFHLCRRFKEATGESLHQYLLKRRIEFAKLALADADTPLVEVALSVGFKTQSHFTTRFRRYTGTTPHVYRTQRLDQALG